MANEPTQYPAPTSQRGGFVRSLRTTPQLTVRQPDLGSPPSVVSVSGFGSGAGAYIRNHGSEADRSQGLIIIRTGPNPGASGAIVLNFPAGVTAGQYVFFLDFATLVIPAPAGNQLTLNWTGLQALAPNRDHHVAYQWATST